MAERGTLASVPFLSTLPASAWRGAGALGLLAALAPGFAAVQATPAPAEAPSSAPAELASPPLPPPSVWLEAGLAYRSTETELATELAPAPRFGVRGVQPLSETAGFYGAFGLQDALALDVGGWFTFLPGPEDLFGFRSFAGAGLTYAAGSFGFALSAAVAYEVAPGTALTFVYTHRPLLLPALGQSFDLSFGVRLDLPGAPE
jgi:hypothetical protein